MTYAIDAPLKLFTEDAQDGFSAGLLPIATGIPHYFVLPQVLELGNVLRAQGAFFIEIGNYDTLGKDLAMLQEGAPDFGLCLTSLHVYEAQVATIITSALNDRFGMSRLKKMHIMTCLQEALSNAVIHGNLCIHCERDSLEAFDRYYERITQALGDARFKDMRVYIRAWDYQGGFHISITHEGQGQLKPDMIAESHPEKEKRPGRGLFIIQSLAEQVTTDAQHKSIDITFTY